MQVAGSGTLVPAPDGGVIVATSVVTGAGCDQCLALAIVWLSPAGTVEQSTQVGGPREAGSSGQAPWAVGAGRLTPNGLVLAGQTSVLRIGLPLAAGLDTGYGAGVCGQGFPNNSGGGTVILADGRVALLNVFGSVLFLDANGHPDKRMGPGGYVNVFDPAAGVASATTLFVLGGQDTANHTLFVTTVPLAPPQPPYAPGVPSWATGFVMFDASGGVINPRFAGTSGGGVFCGSLGGTALAAPIVGGATNPAGVGYWMVGSDGGVFSFGDARFFGSTGAVRLNQPVVGMAATADGGGYWLVAADGGIFSFGDARFFGSTGNVRLNQPIVAIRGTPDGGGYWLVAADGGIFNFGDAGFFGSTGAMRLNEPIVAMAATPDGGGYWLAARDGGLFAFGDAPFRGAIAAPVPASPQPPVVGLLSRASPDYVFVRADGSSCSDIPPLTGGTSAFGCTPPETSSRVVAAGVS
jgi:hypothetical protein